MNQAVVKSPMAQVLVSELISFQREAAFLMRGTFGKLMAIFAKEAVSYIAWEWL